MTSVTFNAIASAIGGAGNFIATDLWATNQSGNFQLLAGAINLALDSANYSNSSFLSQHIRPGQVNSEHVAASQINSAKISTVQIGEVQQTVA
jgi:hypothetical protein